jgi:hypothetical protein
MFTKNLVAEAGCAVAARETLTPSSFTYVPAGIQLSTGSKACGLAAQLLFSKIANCSSNWATTLRSTARKRSWTSAKRSAWSLEQRQRNAKQTEEEPEEDRKHGRGNQMCIRLCGFALHFLLDPHDFFAMGVTPVMVA